MKWGSIMNYISIIGGDRRIVELIKILQEDENNRITLYGMEKTDEFTTIERVTQVQDLNSAINNSETIITSIPLSKDGEIVNVPYSSETIYVKDIFEISKNKKIITGNITETIEKNINLRNNNEIIDVLKLDELAILNAIPTAEGAIQVAMEKSNITLHNSNCLVMGFGRIGKILSKMLLALGAKVYCEARKPTDLAFIQALGYNSVDIKNLKENLYKFDFIFNTIPFVVLDENCLKNVNKECWIIDLASKPGGVDFETAQKLGIKTEWALALPGKVAPKTSAKYIYEIIKEL
jgi:dipicolinate synthase subunit A